MNEKLINSVYFGIVEDINDPKKQGRVKIRVQNIFEGIPLAHIPWASPYIIPNGKAFYIPPLGKIVNVIFDNGSLYSPYYYYTDKYNINLQDKLESLSNDDYENFNALLFDHRTQIYSETDKFTLDFKLNKITIDNESINLEAKDNSQRINLGSKNADQRIILGDNFIDWFYEFAKLMINPANMNAMGSPVVKPAIDMHLNKFMMNKGTFLSANVFVPDNSAIDTLQRDTITSEVEHDDLSIVAPNENFGVGDSVGNGASQTKSNAQGNTSNVSKDVNTTTNISELSSSSVNVEESSSVSEESKKKIIKKQEKEKKAIEESKPKLVLKIPIPYTDRYLDIKLQFNLKLIAGGILAALGALLLAKILSKYSNKFPIKEQEFNVSQDDILKDLDKLKNGNINVPDKKDLTLNVDDGVSDEYIKNKKTNKNKKQPFSYLKRGRNDILNSTNVEKRNPDNKQNKNNPNYGNYY